MIAVAAPTLLAGITEVTRIASAVRDAGTTSGVLCIRRPDHTLVAVLVDDDLPAGTIRDEEL